MKHTKSYALIVKKGREKYYYCGMTSPWDVPEDYNINSSFVIKVSSQKADAVKFPNKFDALNELCLVEWLRETDHEMINNVERVPFKLTVKKIYHKGPSDEFDLNKTSLHFKGIRKGMIEFAKQKLGYSGDLH